GFIETVQQFVRQICALACGKRKRRRKQLLAGVRGHREQYTSRIPQCERHSSASPTLVLDRAHAFEEEVVDVVAAVHSEPLLILLERCPHLRRQAYVEEVLDDHACE